MFWFNRVFPKVSNILSNLSSVFAESNSQSTTQFAHNLVGNDADDLSIIHDSILETFDINSGSSDDDDDDISDAQINEDVSKLREVLDSLFESYQGTVRPHVPPILKKTLKRLSKATKPWIKVEVFAGLAYLWVRKQMSSQAVNLLLLSLHQLSYDPNCVSILRSGPANIWEFLICVLKSKSKQRLFKSTVAAGEYDKSIAGGGDKITDASKLKGGQHDVVFGDPIAFWQDKAQSFTLQLYIQLLRTQRGSRHDFFYPIYPHLQTSDFNKQVCCQFPFFRSIGQVVRDGNKLKREFPLYIVPGLIISCTDDDAFVRKSTTQSPNLSSNVNDDDITIETNTNQLNNNNADDDILAIIIAHPSTKFLFVTQVLHNYVRYAHANKPNEDDVCFDLNKENMTEDDWKLVESNPATLFASPRVQGVSLIVCPHTTQSNPNTVYLTHQLPVHNQLFTTEWDIVEIGKNQTIQTYHSQIGDLFANHAIITPNYEHELYNAHWLYFTEYNDDIVDNDNNNRSNDNIDSSNVSATIPIDHKMPEISYIREIFAWVSKPELYNVPKNVLYYTFAQFIDALQIRHASTQCPSLQMVQIRDLNADPTDIHSVAFTWYKRGTAHVLPPITRALQGAQVVGRQTQIINLDSKQCEPGVIFAGFGPIVTDRPARSDVSKVANTRGINSTPKILGYFPDYYPLDFWRLDKSYTSFMRADLIKTQGLINAVVAFIRRFKNDSRMTVTLIENILRGVGLQYDIHLSESNMPTLALNELMNFEPSHGFHGGQAADASRGMIDHQIGVDPDHVREHIFEMIWDSLQTFCKSSYEDNVNFQSIRTSKTGWKFIYNYIGCLRLDILFPCITGVNDAPYRELIRAFEMLLLAITRPFGVFSCNKQRMICIEMYLSALKIFRESKIGTPQERWSNQKVSGKKKKQSPKQKKQKQQKQTFKEPSSSKLGVFIRKYLKNNPGTKLSGDISVHANLQQWIQLYYEDLQKQKEDADAQYFAKYGRTKQLRSSQDLPHAQSIIAKPNFVYALEFFFIDWYEYGIPSLLNSMIFESSLRLIC